MKKDGMIEKAQLYMDNFSWVDIENGNVEVIFSKYRNDIEICNEFIMSIYYGNLCSYFEYIYSKWILISREMYNGLSADKRLKNLMDLFKKSVDNIIYEFSIERTRLINLFDEKIHYNYIYSKYNRNKLLNLAKFNHSYLIIIMKFCEKLQNLHICKRCNLERIIKSTNYKKLNSLNNMISESKEILTEKTIIIVRNEKIENLKQKNNIKENELLLNQKLNLEVWDILISKYLIKYYI
jgi:hypothetical protein